MTYIFKVKKNKLSIELNSENKNLIAQEFGKFAASFIGVEYTETKNLSLISSVGEEKTIAQQVYDYEEKNTLKEPVKFTSKPNLPDNFAQLLKAKEAEEKNNVVEKKVSELKNTYLQMQNIIREKNLKKEVDYIVASAYCLAHYEGASHFTEEQLKAKIAPFFDEELDHNFVLDAVSENLIRVLPDFTGFSDTIEFELTQLGEEYFLNEL